MNEKKKYSGLIDIPLGNGKYITIKCEYDTYEELEEIMIHLDSFKDESEISFTIKPYNEILRKLDAGIGICINNYFDDEYRYCETCSYYNDCDRPEVRNMYLSRKNNT